MSVDNPIIALAGNPNVGKSTVFNALTGLKQHTGNWCGKTVANAYGTFKHNENTYTVADLPGCYSLTSSSAEEQHARDFLCSSEASATVVVCDATCLERNLILVLQILELTPNVIVCVNLMDEAAKKGIQINLKYLEESLGIPVIGTSARSKKGMTELKNAIVQMLESPHEIIRPKDCTKNKIRIISEWIQNGLILNPKQTYHKDRKIDSILTGKYTAFPIMFLALLGIFWITIVGANYPSQALETLFFDIMEPHLLTALQFLKIPNLIIEMLVFGVFRVLAWVIAVMLPPMSIFFPLFTLLEDVGFLPRIAFNLDNAFKKCGSCGKQALTTCMGFGCNAAGVTGCRIINSPKERLIAIITNNFVPCNGRFPILIAVISMFFLHGKTGIFETLLSAALLTSAIMFGIAMTFLTSKILSKTMLKGMPSSFVLELPPYRRPQIGKVIARSILDRTLYVLWRAIMVAAPAGLVIWLIANVTVPGGDTILAHTASALSPFANLMGLDGVILLAFILGFPANEIVFPIIIMAYMSQGSLMELESLSTLKDLLITNGWTVLTAINVMIFTILHWPCSTTCLTIKSETKSFKWTLISFLTPTIMGIAACIFVTFISKFVFFS